MLNGSSITAVSYPQYRISLHKSNFPTIKKNEHSKAEQNP